MNTPKPFASAANSGASADAQPPAGRAGQWKVMAQEVSGEEDPAKLTKLIAELNQALGEQPVGGPPPQILLTKSTRKGMVLAPWKSIKIPQ